MEDISIEDIREFISPYHGAQDIFAIGNICNNIYQGIRTTLKSKHILKILNINGFKNENKQIVLDEIKICLSQYDYSTVRSWKELYIFLKLYYSAIDGTLTDKLYLLDYCYNSNVIRRYLYYDAGFRCHFDEIRIREILKPTNNGIARHDMNELCYYCVPEIIYNKFNHIISRDIILLNKKIEKQKNNMVILDYIMNYERNITEKGVRNIVLDFIFPSLKKTILIQQEIKYKVLLEE